MRREAGMEFPYSVRAETTNELCQIEASCPCDGPLYERRLVFRLLTSGTLMSSPFRLPWIQCAYS